MRHRKVTTDSGQNQDQPFNWDAFNRASLANLEQSIILCIQVHKSSHLPAHHKEVTKYEQELNDFYKREDVRRLLYPIATPPQLPATKPKQFRKKTVHLICIDEEYIAELHFLDRYTSPGAIVSKCGSFCYPINELNGELYLVERFAVSKKP